MSSDSKLSNAPADDVEIDKDRADRNSGGDTISEVGDFPRVVKQTLTLITRSSRRMSLRQNITKKPVSVRQLSKAKSKSYARLRKGRIADKDKEEEGEGKAGKDRLFSEGECNYPSTIGNIRKKIDN